jgi:hypothetical protein
MSRPAALKDANRLKVAAILVVNTVVLFFVLQSDGTGFPDVHAILNQSSRFIPGSVAFAFATLANGMLSATTKARLVFFRWRHALPAHRAFSQHSFDDPRIDQVKLKKVCGNKIPSEPGEQNALWYRLYKTIEDHPAVTQVHKDFLLMRDYTALAAIFIVLYGATSSIFAKSWIASLIYWAGLIVQFAAARRAAAVYGTRFVTTVLAQKAALRK